MKLPMQHFSIGTVGATGIALMVLHLTGNLIGWAWPIAYTFIILVAAGQENRRQLKNFG